MHIKNVKDCIRWIIDSPARTARVLLFTILIVLLWPIIFFYFVTWEYWSIYKNDHKVISHAVSFILPKDKAPRIVVNIDKIDFVLKQLLEDLHADSIVLWSADMAKDIRQVEYLRTKEHGLNSDFNGNAGKSILFSEQLFKILSKMIKSGVFCADHFPISPAGKFLAVNDIKWGCVAKIPQNNDYLLLGGISIGFKEKQEDIERIEIILKDAAQKLTN